MSKIKLTKNELRTQQNKLNQLLKYLPTLQLKKALLQAEVTEARLELVSFETEFLEEKAKVVAFAELLTEPLAINVVSFAHIEAIDKEYDNIAGIDIPSFTGCRFPKISYELFDTPIWLESAIFSMRQMMQGHAKVLVAKEKLALLEHELREVSIRVNLFEKVLIPRAQNNIKKIKIFLGDQELAAVSQAKVAKAKIEERKLVHQLITKGATTDEI